MSETVRLKDPSPLVQSVFALDGYFGELERIGTKLNELKLKSDSDFEQARKLLALFSVRGESLTEKLRDLSQHLSEAQTRASAIADRVRERAEFLKTRDSDSENKLKQFQLLGEKVQTFNVAVSQLRKPEGAELTDDDRKEITDRLQEFDAELDPMIEERKESAGTLMRRR